MTKQTSQKAPLITMDPAISVWDKVFMVAPLVLVGTRDEGGGCNLATKHMVTPLSWQNHVGFVCAPTHGTCRNIKRTGIFTISYLRPSQVLTANLAAAARQDDHSKPALDFIRTFPAVKVEGELVEDAFLYLECELDRIVDGFASNCLIAGRIVHAQVRESALRREDRDDSDLIHQEPVLTYLHPGRFASISDTFSFPFPPDMRK